MPLPIRRNVSALIAQARLEPLRLIILTEGESDRDALAIWGEETRTPIDAYVVGDFEIPEDNSIKGISGHKLRIASLCKNDPSDLRALRNWQGLIDRDFDDLINNVLCFPNLLYTKDSSLFATNVDFDLVYETIQKSFRRQIDFTAFSRALFFSQRFLCLKAALATLNAKNGTIELRKYVLSDYTFDWNSYLLAVSMKNGIHPVTLSDTLSALLIKNLLCDYHAFVKFVFLCGKKEGHIPSNVSEDELYRVFFRSFLSSHSSQPDLRNLGVIAASLP